MKILITYLMFLIPGQVIAGLAGLAADQLSKAVGITVFIFAYYAMFWVAWRLWRDLKEQEDQKKADAAHIAAGGVV